MRSVEVQRAERAWLTRELTGGRTGLDAAWVALVLLNLVAIAAWPSWDTVPFHLISTGFAVLYGLRLWPADPVLWGLGIVIITTFGGIGLDLLHNNQSVEEAAEIPLLAAMFVAIVWLANRRIGADRERQLIGEKNSRLLEAQRRFLQDASHHLRTPITIALTHAELLARDLDGRELRDIQTVLGEITRLRRLSERLLMIAAAEDPGFLRTEPVLLDEFAVELIGRWRPTAAREWKLGPLDAATVLADAERLGLAMDALLENAIRHTRDGDLIQLSVTGGDGAVRIAVSDTGSGIEAGELAHVFDRFRTGPNANGSRGTGRAALVGGDLPRHRLGQVRRDALVHEDLSQSALLSRGVAQMLHPLELDLRRGQLVLRRHRDVLPGRHGERAGDQPGDSGQHDRAVTASAAADPGDQRGVGDQPVHRAEHGRPQPAAGHVPVLAQRLIRPEERRGPGQQHEPPPAQHPSALDHRLRHARVRPDEQRIPGRLLTPGRPGAGNRAGAGVINGPAVHGARRVPGSGRPVQHARPAYPPE